MAATRSALFGEAPNAVAALPGTYGETPSGFRLPDATRLGRVSLQVADLSRSLEFYQGVLGLREVERSDASSVLAARGDDTPLVELHEHEGAKAPPRRSRLGLFHFAILLPNRASLGSFAQHLADIGAYAGSSDHLVSEAFYLQDPDNLGIEVYADRPRNTWKRVGRELLMATDPLDVGDLVRASNGDQWTGMPPGTRIGHVHLHVGELATASAFYSEAMGFDRMLWQYPGALFLGAGGYHHHLGTNTWAGATATSPRPDDAKLLEWTIQLPDETSLKAIAKSLTDAGQSIEWEQDPRGSSLRTADPWGTRVHVEVSA
jgi:catechol 2,3-dioxygenase